MRRAWLWPACAMALLAAAPPAPAQQAANGTAASAPAPRLPAQLPLRRDPPEGSGTGIAWRAATMLLLAGGAGGWLLWRRGLLVRGASPARPLREAQAVLRLSSHALTPQASVHSVRWHGEDILLACTAQQVTVLARRPADRPAEERA